MTRPETKIYYIPATSWSSGTSGGTTQASFFAHKVLADRVYQDGNYARLLDTTVYVNAYLTATATNACVQYKMLFVQTKDSLSNSTPTYNNVWLTGPVTSNYPAPTYSDFATTLGSLNAPLVDGSTSSWRILGTRTFTINTDSPVYTRKFKFRRLLNQLSRTTGTSQTPGATRGELYCFIVAASPTNSTHTLTVSGKVAYTDN